MVPAIHGLVRRRSEVDEGLTEARGYSDPQTLRRMQEDYVGFWVQYKYEDGYWH